MRNRKRLSDLARMLGIEVEAEWNGIFVTGISEDTRQIEPGDLFVAVPGTARDGAHFAADAAARGAAAVVCERLIPLDVPCVVVSDARRALAALAADHFDHPTRELHTVGVTGTNGKTTVCHWIAHLLGRERTELVTTVTNAESGISELTTPPSLVVQQVARTAVETGKTNLVIEASSIGLEQRRLDAVEFDVAAFTNLTHDHLDLHGDLESYLDAKAHLFRQLAPAGWAVVHGDDPAAEAILAASRARAFTVGLSDSADLLARDIAPSAVRTSFLLAQGLETAMVQLPAIGRHNVENALVAAGVAVCSGVALDEIAERLRTAPAIRGRGAVFRNPEGVTAVVDFAHNPDALRRILEMLRSVHDRVVAVFGCPGGSDRAKRPRMGEISGRLADLTILTSDNPKDEPPEAIIDEIAVGLRGTGGAVETCVDRADAVRRGIERARPGDVVLVAGKGHEEHQIVAGERIPYSDARVLESLGFVRSSGPCPTEVRHEDAKTAGGSRVKEIE